MRAELKEGLRSLQASSGGLPYSVRFVGVTEEAFDELVDEDTRAELVDGVMIVHSPASPRHDNIAGFLRALMRAFARHKRLGFVLGPDSLVRLRRGRKVAPDIYFLERRRVSGPLPEAQIEAPPDLAVEVLSPSNRDDDLNVKRPAYHEAGVKEVWLIDPHSEEVMVDRRRGKRYASSTHGSGRVESKVLPGFWIEVSWLWQDELPDELECLREILGDNFP